MNSRTPVFRNTERSRISGFSFLDFGHATRSRSHPVTEIFRVKKRAEKEKTTAASRAASLRSHEDRPNSLFAHISRASPRLFIQNASKLCFARSVTGTELFHEANLTDTRSREYQLLYEVRYLSLKKYSELPVQRTHVYDIIRPFVIELVPL